MEEIHDPGGKVKIKVAEGVVSSAVFSDCGKYRYRLIRRWERLGPLVLFVLQNPSTADENHNDPTVAKCCRYAKRWGYSGVMIGNVCAYRSTDNKQLKQEHFMGSENLSHVVEMAKVADIVVLASGKAPLRLVHDYGLFHFFLKQDLESIGQSSKLHYLKINKDNSYSHPLYLKEDLGPTPEPTAAQVESKEYWDSLSSEGFPVEPVAPQLYIWSRQATAELSIAVEDSLKNFSVALDFEE